jgi:hypothetical protein
MNIVILSWVRNFTEILLQNKDNVGAKVSVNSPEAQHAQQLRLNIITMIQHRIGSLQR